MKTLNLKSVASAFFALALTAVLTVTFAAPSNYVAVERTSHSGFVAAISALVR